MEKYGVPSRRQLKRMSLRQLKAGRYGPYRLLAADMVIRLSSPVTAEDVKEVIFPVVPGEEREYDHLVDWFIGLAGANRCYSCMGTPEPESDGLEFSALVDNTQGGKQAYKHVLTFCQALIREPKVQSLEIDICDPWRFDIEEQTPLVLTHLSLKQGETMDIDGLLAQAEPWFAIR